MMSNGEPMLSVSATSTSDNFAPNLSTGPFYFTQLLMPAILAAAENSPDKARIAFTSSSAQSTTIKWDTLTDTPARKKMRPDLRYAQSKLVCVNIPICSYFHHTSFFLDTTKANILLANQFARQYGDNGVVVVSLNPGHSSYSYSVCCDHADTYIVSSRWNKDGHPATYTWHSPQYCGESHLIHPMAQY